MTIRMVVAAGVLLLSACNPVEDAPPTRTVPTQEDRSKEFIKDYDERRPVGDVSTDGEVLKFGEVICRRLEAKVHPDDIARTLAFGKDNNPTGMSLRHASELMGSAVANLCPDQKGKLNG